MKSHFLSQNSIPTVHKIQAREGIFFADMDCSTNRTQWDQGISAWETPQSDASILRKQEPDMSGAIASRTPMKSAWIGSENGSFPVGRSDALEHNRKYRADSAASTDFSNSPRHVEAPVILNIYDYDQFEALQHGSYVANPSKNFSNSYHTVCSSNTHEGITESNLLSVLVGLENRTTLMIRRIPRRLQTAELCSIIDAMGDLKGSYDLLYLPILQNAHRPNRGYAFINFKHTAFLALFLATVLSNKGTDLSNILSNSVLVLATVQGKEAMIANLFRTRESTPENRSFPPGMFIQ
jgi:hypothetical protein